MILDGFPTFFEDEILYSALARFYDRVGYMSMADVRREILGGSGRYFTIALPRSVRFIASQIPFSLGYTAKYIILNHTLFCTIAANKPFQRSKSIYRMMLSRNPGHIAYRVGFGWRDAPFI